MLERPDGGAAEARDLRDLRRARRHGRAHVRRHRPHLHPRAARRGGARGDAARRSRRCSRSGRRRSRRCSTARPPGASSTSTPSGARAGSAGRTLLDANVEREARGLVVQGHSTVRDVRRGRRDARHRAARARRRVRRSRRGWSSSARSTSARRWRRWPRRVGYRVTIADPRRAFLASPRFSAFADTVAAWPDAVLDGVELGPRDAVLVFTHDPKLDVPAVQAALAHGRGLRRRARLAQDDRRPQRAAARRGRGRRGHRARLRALRARHRRLDGGGDGGRGAGGDHRPPRGARGRPAARGLRADPAQAGRDDGVGSVG